MEYAKSLIKRKAGQNSTAAARAVAADGGKVGVAAAAIREAGLGGAGGGGLVMAEKEYDEQEEESWTFVGTDEPDPELTTPRLSDGLVMWPAGGLRGVSY